MKPISFTSYKTALAEQPDSFFEALQIFDFDSKAEALIKRMMLSPEQGAALTMGMYYVLLGLRPAEEFKAGLIAEGKLNDLQAEGLSSEALDLIVLPLEEKIFEVEATTNAPVEEGEIEETPPVKQDITADIEQEQQVFKESDIILEEEVPIQTKEKEVTEDRDAILENIENPQKSEGVALDKMVPKQEPTHTTSIPIRPTPTIFETGPMGPSPMPVSPPLQGGVIGGRGGLTIEPTTPNPSLEKEGGNPPESLPIEPDEPTTPVVNTIPITTTPTAPEKKRIENPGPIAINIPTPIIEKTIPIVTAVEPTPVVVIKEATPTPPQVTPPQEVPTIPSTPKEPVFKDIPKVTIVDVGSLAPKQEPEGNPLEQPELLKAAQEHLRQLARERQKGFIAQKMTTTFSLPKTETMVGSGATKIPQPSSDPYKETL